MDGGTVVFATGIRVGDKDDQYIFSEGGTTCHKYSLMN